MMGLIGDLFAKAFKHLMIRLKDCGPKAVEVNNKERFRATIGALLGILITAILCFCFMASQTVLFVIAPMGASAVLLFALPSSPLAQPWAVLVGNIVSAGVGVSCFLLIANVPLAAAVSVSTAIALMFVTRSLHPPGGAIALYAVLGGPDIHSLGFDYVLAPVGINSLVLIISAMIFNNLTRHPYPHRQLANPTNVHKTKDALPTNRAGFNSKDLDVVLQQYNEVLDISRDDLEYLMKQTEMQSYRRRFEQITCGDIMSKDIISVEFGTSLEEAWITLRKHKIKALPVLNHVRRIVGIITLVDFMKHANLDVYDSFETKLRNFIRLTRDNYSSKPEVVGQIMTTGVRTAHVNAHIVELVPLLSDAGMHHIPIVDDEHRVLGIVTQSDLVAALYRVKLTENINPQANTA